MVHACPVCHASVPDDNQAFLDGCFHLFCYQCINRWSEQRLTTDALLTCPLCRQGYRSVFFNCVLEQSNSRQWFVEDREEDGMTLTVEHIERRSVYYSAEREKQTLTIRSPVSSTLKKRSVLDAEAQRWMIREMEALLAIRNVQLIVEMATRISDTAVSTADAEAALVVTMEPFLYQHAKRFANELLSFLSSGLNIAGYDAFVADAMQKNTE